MKQLLIGKSKSYSAVATANDLTAIPDGVLGIYKLSDYTLAATAGGKIAEDFMVVLGRDNTSPLVFPEVNVANLEVTKAEPQAGKAFKATIVVPTAVDKGETYSIRVNKTDVVFNERNSWTFDTVATDTTGSKVADALRKAINSNNEYLGVKASGTGCNVIITGNEVGKGYTVSTLDGLSGVTLTINDNAEPAILDAAYVKDLASRCAAGKGFQHTSHEGSYIYPGYPEVVEDVTYVEYTLRFATTRKSGKTTDEPVTQLLHIVVPSGSACIADLDAILLGKTASSPAA